MAESGTPQSFSARVRPDGVSDRPPRSFGRGVVRCVLGMLVDFGLAVVGVTPSMVTLRADHSGLTPDELLWAAEMRETMR